MTNVLSCFNMQRALSQRPSFGDLPPTVQFVCIKFPFLLLTAQVPPKSTALSFVRINMLVKCFMADEQLYRNLLWTPLQTQQGTGLLSYPRGNGCDIATVLCSLYRELIVSLGATATRPPVNQSCTSCLNTPLKYVATSFLYFLCTITLV